MAFAEKREPKWQSRTAVDVDAVTAEVERFLRELLPADWVAAVDANDSARSVWCAEKETRTNCGGGSARPATSHRRGRRSTAVSASRRRWAPRSRVRSAGTGCRASTTRSASISPVRPSCAGAPTSRSSGSSAPIARHDDIWCQLFSEPGAGSDLAGLATRAVRDGDTWIVRGQKVWTSLGDVSHYGLLLARTDPDVPKHKGITAFLVPMVHPGVTVRPLRQITGDAEFCEVFFDDARDRRLDAPGRRRTRAGGSPSPC